MTNVKAGPWRMTPEQEAAITKEAAVDGARGQFPGGQQVLEECAPISRDALKRLDAMLEAGLKSRVKVAALLNTLHGEDVQPGAVEIATQIQKLLGGHYSVAEGLRGFSAIVSMMYTTSGVDLDMTPEEIAEAIRQLVLRDLKAGLLLPSGK
jgi:hypothetical protein